MIKLKDIIDRQKLSVDTIREIIKREDLNMSADEAKIILASMLDLKEMVEIVDYLGQKAIDYHDYLKTNIH